jgi:hypothetical protein
VDSLSLTTAQASKLMEQVGHRLRYVGRLRRRMELMGFPPDDPMYLAATRAFNALQELHILGHYASCTSGVAKGGHAARRPPKLSV